MAAISNVQSSDLPAKRRKANGSAVKSNISGFYKLSVEERRALLCELMNLEANDIAALAADHGLTDEKADQMVENTLGVLGMPLGLCVNMQIDGRDWLIPMSVEEPSVVAAASHASKLIRAGGGVTIEATPPHMIGQIQILDVPDLDAAEAALHTAKEELLARANECDPILVKLGGGAFDIEVRHLPQRDGDPVGDMLVAHLLVDVRDAMGANAINTMCECLAPKVENLTGGRVRLRILSNLADRRVVVARGKVPFSALEGKGCGSGEALARGIEEASIFAERDPYRAATHNKGIMNGVDAVLLAFGQDWRAVEAGAHAYAARDGHYGALATWRVRDGYLEGRLEMPMAVGIVGGVAQVHPTVQAARRIAPVQSATELGALATAVGLAQNLGALRALSAEGIQRGHMRLHARNVAAEAGAEGDEVQRVADLMVEENCVRADAAQRILTRLRSS